MPAPISMPSSGHFVTQALTGGAGWKSYVDLISKVAMTNRWNDLVRDHFDETANMFAAKLRDCLPDHSEEALYRGFAFTLQLGLQIISQNRRVDSLSAASIPAGISKRPMRRRSAS
jgi:hypothetical protein